MSIKNKNAVTPQFKPAQDVSTHPCAHSFNAKDYLDAGFNELTNILAHEEKSDMLLKPSKKEVCQEGFAIWPVVPADRFAGQPSAQIQMLEAIRTTREGILEMADDVLSRRILEVRFTDNTIYWESRKFASDYTSYYLKNLALKAKFLGEGGSYGIFCRKEDFMSAYAVFGHGALTNAPQGFLLAERDGEVVIYELDEFSLVASVDNAPHDATFDEWEKLDENRVFFTCFNKSHGLLHVETPKLPADGLIN